MPNPSDIPSFIQTLTAALVADILESCSADEIVQLVEELELRRRRSRLH
jgi:Mg/Co/Ni transporter MgtE